MIKIVCFILLLSQLSNSLSIPDEDEDNFEKLIVETDLLIDESYNVIDKISLHSKEIDDYQEQELQNLINLSIYKNSLDDLKSSKVIECINKYKGDIEKLLSDTKVSVEECAEVILKDIIVLLEDIISVRNLLIQEREKLKFLVEECIKENPTNPIGVAICVRGKGEYIKIQLKQLIEKLKTLLDDVKYRTEESLKHTKSCIENQTTEAISVIKKYVSEVKECIKKT